VADKAAQLSFRTRLSLLFVVIVLLTMAGCVRATIAASVLTPEQLVAALRAGAVDVVVQAGGPALLTTLPGLGAVDLPARGSAPSPRPTTGWPPSASSASMGGR
jgi:hypothetical protein